MDNKSGSFETQQPMNGADRSNEGFVEPLVQSGTDQDVADMQRLGRSQEMTVREACLQINSAYTFIEEVPRLFSPWPDFYGNVYLGLRFVGLLVHLD